MDFNQYTMKAPEITPGSTSYFSAPSDELDPHLFQGTHINSWVRQGILGILFEYLSRNFNSPHTWTKAWLAGSGVSYQWEASRAPGDLDCLVGIDYVKFRELNQDYIGFSNQEIASMFNEGFNTHVMPTTRNWEGYELTFYVNPATDIRYINPYAAYDLIADVWTVEPDRTPQPPYVRDWEQKTMRDLDMATEIVNRYKSALAEMQSTTNPAYKINAQRKLQIAEEQAIAFFDDIHAARKVAFSQIGKGYSDFNNYRWQAGKRSGAVQAMRQIKELHDDAVAKKQQELYGVGLPTANTLIRRTLRGGQT